MGLLDKVKSALIVEEGGTVPVREAVTYQASTLDISVPVDTANVLNVDTIYESMDLTDKEKSVYKVEEIKNSLGTLAKEAAKAATVGMMGVIKLTAEEVQADAASRTEVLIDALTQFSAETSNIKNELQTGISEMEEKINDYKKAIAERELEQEKSQEIIAAELERIKSIADFIA